MGSRYLARKEATMTEENEAVEEVKVRETEAAAPKTGDVVKNKEFKTQGDWISEVMEENCRDEKGNTDVDKTRALCAENGIELKDYPNLGMVRMNAGNMLRSRARKRHGLYINGEWVSAPAAFTAGHEKTQNPDGSTIAKAVSAAPEEGSGAEQEAA